MMKSICGLFTCLVVLLAIIPKPGWTQTSVTANSQLMFSIGYATLSGNTVSETRQLDLFYDYNQRWDFEWTAKALLAQSSIAQNSFNYQRFQLRYGKSLNHQWYGFLAEGLEQNQQTQLDHRNEIRLGSGFWFADNPEWLLAFEFSAGVMDEKYASGVDQNLTVYSLGNHLLKQLSPSFEIREEWLSTRKNQSWLHRLNLTFLNSLTSNWNWGLNFEYVWDDSTPLPLLPWDQRLNFQLGYRI